jgi:hypothetical protein
MVGMVFYLHPHHHNPVIPTTNLLLGVLMVTMTSKVMLRKKRKSKKSKKSKKKTRMAVRKKLPLLPPQQATNQPYHGANWWKPSSGCRQTGMQPRSSRGWLCSLL